MSQQRLRPRMRGHFHLRNPRQGGRMDSVVRFPDGNAPKGTNEILASLIEDEAIRMTIPAHVLRTYQKGGE